MKKKTSLLALAAALVRRRNQDATMCLLPADHVIRPAKLFQETLLAAAEQAQSGALVTLGITQPAPPPGTDICNWATPFLTVSIKLPLSVKNRMRLPQKSFSMTATTAGTAACSSGNVPPSAKPLPNMHRI